MQGCQVMFHPHEKMSCIGGSLGVKKVNAAGAMEGLTSDPNTVLIDVRSREEVKEQGSPNLSSTKKKAIILPFTRVRGSAISLL